MITPRNAAIILFLASAILILAALMARALEIRLGDGAPVLVRDNGTTVALSNEDLDDFGLSGEARRKMGADERFYTRAEAFERADETTLTTVIVTIRKPRAIVDEATSRTVTLADEVTTRALARRVKTGNRVWRLRDRVWITPGGRYVGPK